MWHGLGLYQIFAWYSLRLQTVGQTVDSHLVEQCAQTEYEQLGLTRWQFTAAQRTLGMVCRLMGMSRQEWHFLQPRHFVQLLRLNF